MPSAQAPAERPPCCRVGAKAVLAQDSEWCHDGEQGEARREPGGRALLLTACEVNKERRSPSSFAFQLGVREFWETYD